MINVVILAAQPVAGSPYQRWKCLQKYAGDHLYVRFIIDRSHYSDGRSFPYDLLWSDHIAQKILTEAHVIHIENTLQPHWLPYINKKKQRIIGLIHSVPRQQRWRELLQYAHQTYVIRQPLQMREYPDLPTLPNMIDIWDASLCPCDRVWEYPLIINYSPTNKNLNTHPGSKGYQTVHPILQSYAKDERYRIVTIQGQPYLENLRQKQAGHIIIDDIASRTFHLTGLEGCAFGQTVIESFGPQDGWDCPFITATPETFASVFSTLCTDPSLLRDLGSESRQWIERFWNPRYFVEEYCQIYEGG